MYLCLFIKFTHLVFNYFCYYIFYLNFSLFKQLFSRLLQNNRTPVTLLGPPGGLVALFENP